MTTTNCFDFGFDWNAKPILGVRDGVFPLQLYMVNVVSNSVLSPSNPSDLCQNDKLYVRVCDFTDVEGGQWPQGEAPIPLALQVLFTSDVDPVPGQESPPFSPFQDSKKNQVSQFVFTQFLAASNPSPGFGSALVNKWRASIHGGYESWTMQNSGRFKFRALLTVGVPGQPAKFFRIDPEMVVGPAGGPGT